MRKFLKLLSVFVVLSAVALGISAGLAGRASSSPIKELMGENFQNVQVVLYNLVTANYDRLPAQIAVLRDHATKLAKGPPEGIAPSEFEKRLFVTYATELERATNNMLTAMAELRRHDTMPSEPGKLNVDYLRVVVARHFGEAVTGCVLCHNQFRRISVK